MDGNDLFTYCVDHDSKHKIEKILRTLICDVYSSASLEEKIQAFHICTVFINLITGHLSDANFAVYFIRTVSFFLLNLIRSGIESNSILSLMACKYFHTFLTLVLPTYTETIQAFFNAIVSVLVPIASLDGSLGRECLDVLNYMIVTNAGVVRGVLAHVDPFPSSPAFEEIRQVYMEVRSSVVTSLESEIRSFLGGSNKTGHGGPRTEGLKHLKAQLAGKMTELKQLYDELQDLRGFSEDCGRSILHQLICELVTLALSSDADESMEATRCLGELGPGDLQTLVLKIEKKFDLSRCAPMEIVAGNVVPLLTEYLVSADVRMIQSACDALYAVLDSKEGKVVLGE